MGSYYGLLYEIARELEAAPVEIQHGDLLRVNPDRTSADLVVPDGFRSVRISASLAEKLATALRDLAERVSQLERAPERVT